MILPGNASFLLIRGSPRESIFRSRFTSVFLPNSHSFVFTMVAIPKSVIQSDILQSDIPEPVTNLPSALSLNSGDSGEPIVLDSSEPTVSDKDKRIFLKMAGIAGLGLGGSLLLPKKAHALIMGSSPTTGVVGVKDSTNVRINPATEETLDQVLKTTDLTFDSGALEVKVTSVSGAGSSSFSDSGDVAKSALVDAQRHVQVDVLSSALPASASTETTLETISFGGYKFTLRLATVGDIDYIGEAAVGTATSAASWRIKRVDNASGMILMWAGTGVFDQIWDNRTILSYS